MDDGHDLALARRRIGRTGLEVTGVCFGGGPLGSMPQAFGYEVPAERAIETVRAILDSPVNFLDTAAMYGEGESERRIGTALAERGGLPEDFVLATKVDRSPDGDFSGSQVRRSLEGSLERLGLERAQLVHLHDPEHISFEEGMAPGGPVETLLQLRDEGLALHVGVAGGPVALLQRYVRTGAFEVLITHNRWTLVDRSAGELIDEAVSLGVSVLNAAVFGGGILAAGPDAVPRYAYGPAPEEVLRRVRLMEQACAGHGVPLAAAALQLSLRDERITSSIVGVDRPERVEDTLRLAAWEIPPQLWDELAPLAAPSTLWQW